MDRNSIYFKQVQLLVSLLPFIAKEDCFALKGGTAMNLFVRDFPRLSVDIDLVYLPLDIWQQARDNATAALARITNDIMQNITGCAVQPTKEDTDSIRTIVTRNGIGIKIELSPVMRGSIFPPKVMEVNENVEDNFGYAKIKVMDFSDLYAGKICAALSRQHPRDLFDIKLLLENEGIDENLRKAFIVYLISNNRPISDLLKPNRKDIRDIFINEFMYMSEIPVTVEELDEAREKLIEIINTSLTEDERKFLISFKSLSPEWSLLGLQDIDNLPAVKWKMINLQKMPKDKHKQAMQKLMEILLK